MSDGTDPLTDEQSGESGGLVFESFAMNKQYSSGELSYVLYSRMPLLTLFQVRVRCNLRVRFCLHEFCADQVLRH